MLQRCARASQGVWGLNQEMFGTAGLILSRVLASGVGGEARPAILQLLQKNGEASRKAGQSGNGFELFMFTADDKELASAAVLLQKDGSPEARSLFPSLIESHEINRTPPSEYGNARRRERLMKTLFAANYARQARPSQNGAIAERQRAAIGGERERGELAAFEVLLSRCTADDKKPDGR